MKSKNEFVVFFSGTVAAYCLIILIVFAFNYTDTFLYNMFLSQLLACFAASGSVFVYSLMPYFRKTGTSTKAVSKIVLLTDTNAPADEFLLLNRTSALIVKGDYVYISLENDYLVDEFAVLNRVENEWFIERSSEDRKVGLKRVGEQYIYKLKPGVMYKLCYNDTIFIENDRLLLM